MVLSGAGAGFVTGHSGSKNCGARLPLLAAIFSVFRLGDQGDPGMFPSHQRRRTDG
jgi:hypothetical protein